jgi:hypothetical protein
MTHNLFLVQLQWILSRTPVLLRHFGNAIPKHMENSA